MTTICIATALVKYILSLFKFHLPSPFHSILPEERYGPDCMRAKEVLPLELGPEYTFRPCISRAVPDFEQLQEESERRREEYVAASRTWTTPQPFEFHTTAPSMSSRRRRKATNSYEVMMCLLSFSFFSCVFVEIGLFFPAFLQFQKK